MSKTPRDVIATLLELTSISVSHANTEADSIISTLSSAGFAIVPKEPTEAMIDAGIPPLMKFGRVGNAVCNAYRAMIEAGRGE